MCSKIKPKVIGLVQARMGSSRLPGKVMMTIEDKPLVGHIYSRLKAVKSISEIILATTVDPKNDILINYTENQNILTYRHDRENDIIGRLYYALKMTGADAILKINADCPLVDYNHMNNLVEIYLSNKGILDFVSNKIDDTLPEGYGMELINYKTLEWCHKNLITDEDRELTIMWILNNLSKFNYYCYKYQTNISNLSFTVDTPDDLKKIKNIFKNLYKHNRLFGLEDVLRLTKNKN